MKLRKAKIREALTTSSKYAVMKRRIVALTDAECAEAERIERAGKRRESLLRILRAERYRRSGRTDKMLQLHMETNL
jgi:hypothetical protein